MPRVAQGRTDYLTQDEIARVALGLFDAGSRPPSMRALAKALGTSPASIYHHFANEEAIIRAAVGLVFLEAIEDFGATIGNPLVDDIDPEQFFVGAAVALRRAFLRHFRVAPYLASSPEESDIMAGTLAIFGAALEKMGISGTRAGDAVYTWGHYVYGSILLSASIWLADERFRARTPGYSTEAVRPDDAPPTSPETATSLDRVLDAGYSEDDEAHFVTGLRIILSGITGTAAEGTAGSPS